MKTSFIFLCASAALAITTAARAEDVSERAARIAEVLNTKTPEGEADTKASNLRGHADKALASGDLNQAMTLYRQALEHSYLLDAYIGLSKIYMLQGNYAQAGELLQKTLLTRVTTSPDGAFKTYGIGAIHNPDVLLRYAICGIRTGQLGQVIPSYNTSIAILGLDTVLVPLPVMDPNKLVAPRKVEAFAWLALGLQQGGVFDPTPEQQEYIKTAARLEPSLPVTQYYLGKALLHARQYDEATVAFEAAARLGDDKMKKQVVTEIAHVEFRRRSAPVSPNIPALASGSAQQSR